MVKEENAMFDGFVKTACCSPKIVLADCIGNGSKIYDTIEEMAKENVSLVVFPELSLTGYTCEDLFLQSVLLKEAEKVLKHIIKRTKDFDIVSIIGLPVSVDDKLYNCAAVVCHGKLLGLIPKINIPNYSEFYEVRHFTSGEDVTAREISFADQQTMFGRNIIFKSNIFSFGIEICEDLWVADTPSSELAKAGAQIICNLSASDEVIGKSEYRKTLVMAKSGSAFCGYLYCNAGIGESTTDKVFSGHSMIAENGSLLAESELFSNESLIADIDIQKIQYERRKTNSFAKSKETFYEVSFELPIVPLELSNKYYPYPFVPKKKDVLDGRCKDILNIQSVGLATRLSAIGSSCKAVVGLSGGLDSTLSLIVIAHAFDKLGRNHSDIKAITMPCFGTTDRTYNNACKLAKSYGAELIEIPIQESVKQHFKDIGHNEDVHDVTYENCQARERTQVLMDYANSIGGIVVGTGDLSELALGWATYNADHMSMYNVNCSIPKTLVRYIVEYEANNSEGELSETLRDILDTPVSPELLPPTGNGKISQKTEEIVGPYELHDFFLYYMLRFGFEPKKIFRLALNAFDGVYDEKTILKWEEIFYKRFFTQQFKRSCLPDGPKVGTVTLSPRGDWRMPSDANGKIWFKKIEELKQIIK